MENQQQQQLKPRLPFMNKPQFQQYDFWGYEKHPNYVEEDSDSEDEE